MLFRFYHPPDGVKTWSELIYIQAVNVISFSFNPKFVGYGSFTLVLPYNVRHLRTLTINDIIEAYDDVSGSEWFIIQSISFDTKTITVSGYDLNYLLTLRVSLFSADSAVSGYDPVSGTTAYCIEHYINRNIISPADSERTIPMVFDADSVIGKSSDSYLARLEALSQIVDELCTDANIGYRISGGYRLSGSTAAAFRMKLSAPVDKSRDQSARSPVVLGASRRNVQSIEFYHDVSNYLNAVYATGAGVTQTVYRSEVVPEGVERRECAVDVSAERVADIEKYALYAVRDNIRTDGYNIEPSGSKYGVEYSVGDIVTVRDDALRVFYNALITQAEITIDADGTHIRTVLGQPEPKLLNKIANNIINGTYKKC